MEMKQKYLWVQHGGGDFPMGHDENGNNHITEFNCKFKPQKIKLTGEPVNAKSSFDYFDFIPEDVTMDSGGGGFILEYTDNIEHVRKVWLAHMLSHYKHLQWVGALIELSPDWAVEMPKIVIEAEAHRNEYPELWV